MSKMTRALIVGAAMIAVPMLAAPAMAEDGGDAYVGVSLGYGWSTADATTSVVYGSPGYFASTSVDSINADGVQRVKPGAFIGGIDLGYDYHLGNVVLGLAADISTLNNSRMASITTPYPCCVTTNYTLSQEVKTKYLATIRAKLGVDVGQATIYATGGWAGLGFDYNANFSDTYDSASETASVSKFRSGWVVGGGVDIKLAERWSIQPEFLYADFGTEYVPGGPFSAGTPPDTYPANEFSHSVRIHTSVARVGIHYHF